MLPARLITQALVTKEGSSYSEAQRDKDVDKLKDLYKQYDLTIGDFEAGIDPATVFTLLGTDGADAITLEEISQRAGTIPQEMAVGFDSRLPYTYAEPGYGRVFGA